MKVVFSSGGSGGIAKSSGARALAQHLSRFGGTVLVDGNLTQQSQREYFGLDDDDCLENMLVGGDARERMMNAIVTPDRLPNGAGYAVLPGPISYNAKSLDLLGRSIGELAGLADFVVVDTDRFDAEALADNMTVAGGVMLPWLLHGSEAGSCGVMFRLGLLGSSLNDGRNALDALVGAGVSPNGIGVVATVQPGAESLDTSPEQWRSRLEGLGRYLGGDRWTPASGRLLAERKPGYPDDHEHAWLARAGAWVRGVKPKPRTRPRPSAKRGWRR